MAPNIEDREDRLVIALDFGTTFSGIAYVFVTGENAKVRAIKDWPGLEGKTQVKVPTTICYGPNDPTKFTWGGEEHNGEVIYGIKLLLNPDQDRPQYLPKSFPSDELKQLGKKPVDVAADFISAIYKHALKVIKSRHHSSYFNSCEKEFVLTVPAVRSDKAKDFTLRAAKQAGMDPVTLIKEPEAAALFALNSMKEEALKIGDSFVICDAGGGTVDLISYEITQLSPRLELKELVPSSGSMAGSLGLNRRFEFALNDLLGNDESHRLRKTEAFKMAMDDFDTRHKTKFRGNPNSPFYVNFPLAGLPDIPKRSLSSNCWLMRGAEMKEIFDPLVADIKRLVEGQVNSISLKRLRDNPPKPRAKAKIQNKDFVKAIVLVGGFGSSAYLRDCLEEAHEGIQLIQPEEAWGAIVEGAVLSKLQDEAQVMTILAPRHYGTSASEEYSASEDYNQKKWFDASFGEYRCSKMSWFIESGEELDRGQKIKHNFFRSLEKGYHPRMLIFKDKLYQCESEEQPKYPGAGVVKNCKFKADLRHVDKKYFKDRLGKDGNWYVDIYFDLVITILPAVMKFSLEIDGEELVSVETSYE